MSRAGLTVVIAISLLGAGCAQGDLEAGGSVGMTQPVTAAGDDDDDDGTGDDDDDGDSTTGAASETSTSTAEGTTSAATSSGDGSEASDAETSSGAPVTASAEDSSSVGSGIEESSSGAPQESTGLGDEMAGDEMPMDDGAVPPDPWESCASTDCADGSLCLNVTGLRDYSPYCAPECTTDDDCPYPGGDALVTCALVEEGATEPTHCAVICEYDGDVLGDCPDGMQCADVPDQTTQIAVCMWP